MSSSERVLKSLRGQADGTERRNVVQSAVSVIYSFPVIEAFLNDQARELCGSSALGPPSGLAGPLVLPGSAEPGERGHRAWPV